MLETVLRERYKLRQLPTYLILEDRGERLWELSINVPLINARESVIPSFCFFFPGIIMWFLTWIHCCFRYKICCIFKFKYFIIFFKIICIICSAVGIIYIIRLWITKSFGLKFRTIFQVEIAFFGPVFIGYLHIAMKNFTELEIKTIFEKKWFINSKI